MEQFQRNASHDNFSLSKIDCRVNGGGQGAIGTCERFYLFLEIYERTLERHVEFLVSTFHWLEKLEVARTAGDSRGFTSDVLNLKRLRY